MDETIDVVEVNGRLAVLKVLDGKYTIESLPAAGGASPAPSSVNGHSKEIDVPEAFQPLGLGVDGDDVYTIGTVELESEPAEPPEAPPSELSVEDPFGLMVLDYEMPSGPNDSPARLTEDGLQVLDGPGALVAESSVDGRKMSATIRPSGDEGDHLAVLEVLTDDERFVLESPSQLTGASSLVAGDGQLFAAADTDAGLAVWAKADSDDWEMLSVLEGASADSLSFSATEGLMVLRSDEETSELLHWDSDQWSPLDSDDVAVQNLVTPSAQNFCAGKLVDIKTTGRLEGPTMRYRTARPAAGAKTSHQDRNWTGDFNGGFLDQCNRWSSNVQWHFRNNSPYPKDVMVIDWFGTVGTKACHRPSSSHNRARGFDLTGIYFTNGYRLDCNNAHRRDASSTYQLRYLGVWASLRRKFATVLTAPYKPIPHVDHIHFDNRTRLAPIRTRAETDSKLVQTACNLLNGENLVVDGDWGGKTQAAYQRLLDGFKPYLGALRTKDPKKSLEAADSFLLGIQSHGISHSKIGEWPGYKN